MTVTRYDLIQVHDEINNLRTYIKDLVGVTTNLMDRIERLEQAKNPPWCAVGGVCGCSPTIRPSVAGVVE
jgi:hypothetical protein